MGKQVYVARSRIIQDDGIYRRAYLGDHPQPVVFGIMGDARRYYHYDKLTSEVPGTFDYLPAVIGS